MGKPQKLLGATSKNYTKEEKYHKEQRELKLTEFDAIDFEYVSNHPPKFLQEIGSDEWNRLIPLMKKLPISQLDLNSIAQYCKFYELFVVSSQEVNEHGTTTSIHTKDGIVLKKNPAFDVMLKSSDQIKSLANSLGLNINSRLQIIGNQEMNEDEENDEF